MRSVARSNQYTISDVAHQRRRSYRLISGSRWRAAIAKRMYAGNRNAMYVAISAYKCV